MAARARKRSGAFDRSLSKSAQKAAAPAQTAIPRMRPIQLVASGFQRTAFRTQDAKPKVSRDHITRQNNSSALRRSGNPLMQQILCSNDLAPNFHPVAARVWRLLASYTDIATGQGAEPLRSAARLPSGGAPVRPA